MARRSRKDEILQAALACFTDFGVDATTIEMIRDRSGASIGSLYHHFGNKERIIGALYLAGTAEYAALLAEGFPAERIGSFKLYRPGAGCDACKNGYKGRVGIYEVVKITPELQRLIMEEGNALDIAAKAREEGFNDLRASGLLKAMQGLTSLEEVNRVTKD